jgi:ankyrin repeat protein
MRRKLRRCVQIEPKILSVNKGEFTIVKTDDEYNETCQRYPQKKNIHCLMANQNNKNLIWQKSSGPISKLNEFIIRKDEFSLSIEEEEFFHKNNEKILIISAEPGMGKSLILDNFTQYSSAENFFLKIILNTCKKALTSFDDNLKMSNDLIELVLNSLLGKNDRQEIALVKQLAKEEKLILMFDGLDEVNEHKEQVIRLIDALNCDQNYRIKKILITTRNHLREELEDRFRTFAFNLSNFDDDDQKSFLFKYWRNLNLKHKERATSANLKHAAQYLTMRIKSLLSSENISELIGVPLQTKMLADIFIDKKEGDFSKLDIANVADLYEHFLETKIRIQYEEKNGVKIELLPKKLKQFFDKAKDDFYSDHIKLSLKLLFKTNLEETYDDDKLQEIVDYGVIVDFVTVNRMPSFLHQSFAEFFVARGCVQKIEQKLEQNDHELEQIFRDQRHFLIRRFLNDLLIKNNQTPRENKTSVRDFQKEIRNCCRENLLALLKYFIQQRGASLNTENNEFLITACECGHKDIVVCLLENGIDINQQNKRGSSPLMWASFKEHKEIVRILLQNEHINVNHKEKFGETALIWASKAGKHEIVSILLEQKHIDVNHQDAYEYSALMWSSQKGHKEVVEILLKNKNIDVTTKHGYTGWGALYHASYDGHKEVVKILLENKDINVNQQDNDGLTALMISSIRGHKETVKILSQNENIILNIQDTKKGRNALMYASENGHKEIVQMLMEQDKKIDLNQQDKDGQSALMLASKQGHKEIVQLLEEKTLNIKE